MALLFIENKEEPRPRKGQVYRRRKILRLGWTMHPAYSLTNPDVVYSPGLLFYKDLIAQNIQAMLRRINGRADALRPHVKTHKCPQVVQMQLEAGISKFKCATFAEAEMVARRGGQDILLAYPIVGPNCDRVLAFIQKYPAAGLSVLVDHPVPAEKLSSILARAGAAVGVFLDLDVGQHRTGIPAGPEAVEFYKHLRQLPGLRMEGLSVYDGHNHQEPLKDREFAVRELLHPVMMIRAILEKDGIPVPRIIAGGTPTFPVFARIEAPGLECSPGTCVLHDHGYGARFTDMAEFVPAALVLTRVVSKPGANRLTLDLGTKSIATDPPAGKRCVLLNVPQYEPTVHNEEHFVIETPDADRWQPGDVVYAVPTHICPTVNLHQEAYVVEQNKVTDRWPITARDRKLTI